MEGRFQNRYDYPFGNGNRKTFAKDPDHINLRAISHLAISQVAQEQPFDDFIAWRKNLFAPESALEWQERTLRGLDRAFPDRRDPSTLTYARFWALARHKR